MKSSTLLFRSLAIVIFIAGGAHLVSYTSITSNNLNENYSPDNENLIDSSILKNQSSIPSSKEENTPVINNEIDYIIGKWKVTFNSEDFKGAIIYDLKKEENVFNAYVLEYEDENGNNQKAEQSKALTISKFDGYKGNGSYTIEYEGQKYDVKCAIDMVDANTFKLSYDYYGYGDVETWKKIKK